MSQDSQPRNASLIRKLYVGLLTTVLAVSSALGFEWIGIPLPWMLGPLFLFAVFSFFGFRPFGDSLGYPSKMRLYFVPVVGIMIGARVTPGIVEDVMRWWPSLLLVVPYMVAVQLINATILRRVGGYDWPTAFFGASPGGLVEAVLIGEANGGKGPLMAIQHFARVTLAVSIIPLLLSLELGVPVSSASGLDAAKNALPGIWDVLLLLFAGVVGAYVARRLHMPAAIMVGPILLSGLFHGTGLTDAQIPDALLKAAQLVIGVTLGAQFASPSRGDLLRGLGLSLLTLTCTLIIAFGVATLVAQMGLADRTVSFIAFAPGGLVEMGLIAISLDADPIFVATHHVMRIGLAVTIAPWIYRLLMRWVRP